MKFKILATFVLILILGQHSFCQEKPRKGETILETTLILSEPPGSNNSKQVLLFEDSLFLIITSGRNFEELSKAFIKSYRRDRMSKADSTLYYSVLNESKWSNLVNASRINSTLKEKSYLEYLIVECLEQNKCYIQNKVDMKLITTVKKQAYHYRCGFDCGDDGRRYLIDNRIFFFVVDMII